MQLKRFKHILDLLLGIGLLLLMSYQVTGEAGHEWTGISMTILMLLHQAVNARWYAALFRGRYSPLRAVQTLTNMALLLCFLLTALCGINMSVHAVPFLSEFMRASLGRRLHLTLSHWCFVLMGLHLGLHVPGMLRGIRSLQMRRAGGSVPSCLQVQDSDCFCATDTLTTCFTGCLLHSLTMTKRSRWCSWKRS